MLTHTRAEDVSPVRTSSLRQRICEYPKGQSVGSIVVTPVAGAAESTIFDVTCTPLVSTRVEEVAVAPVVQDVIATPSDAQPDVHVSADENEVASAVASVDASIVDLNSAAEAALIIPPPIMNLGNPSQQEKLHAASVRLQAIPAKSIVKLLCTAHNPASIVMVFEVA